MSQADPVAPGPILVVGGRGFVGAAVVRHLVAGGRSVHVFGPDSPVALPEGATQTLGSIEDRHAVVAVIRAVKPTEVINLAAFSAGPVGLSRSGEADPERMLAVNVLGWRHLLDAVVEAGIGRLFYMSSTVVLGRDRASGKRLNERAARRPVIAYGMSKVLAEDLADYYRERHGLETVGLRLPLVVGPGLWYDGAAAAFKRLVDAAVSGGKEPVRASSVAFDAMHVADVGELIEALLGRPAGSLAPIYHVAGFTTSYRDVIRVLGELVPGFAPEWVEEAPAIVYPLVSQSRLERDCGWRTRRDLYATLADVLAQARYSRASPP